MFYALLVDSTEKRKQIVDSMRKIWTSRITESSFLAGMIHEWLSLVDSKLQAPNKS